LLVRYERIGPPASRLAVLDAAEARLGRDLVAAISAGGLAPAELHARLDGTPYAAAAALADWLFGCIRSDTLDDGNG
jgi:hypothetical protein